MRKTNEEIVKCWKKSVNFEEFLDDKLSWETSSDKEETTLFDNLPRLMRPKAVSDFLGVSVNTIYDWKYRGAMRNVPENLFLKINQYLYVRGDVLKEWISSQNACL